MLELNNLFLDFFDFCYQYLPHPLALIVFNGAHFRLRQYFNRSKYVYGIRKCDSGLSPDVKFSWVITRLNEVIRLAVRQSSHNGDSVEHLILLTLFGPPDSAKCYKLSLQMLLVPL